MTLDPRQTGRELVILQARLFGTSREQAADRAQQLVAAGDRRIKLPGHAVPRGSRPALRPDHGAFDILATVPGAHQACPVTDVDQGARVAG
ncbi:MAG: hypothetical protein M3Q20_06245 [Actinomycetota bacterium]|nr:hypothetical protein [Actinomycetota bacterium]